MDKSLIATSGAFRQDHIHTAQNTLSGEPIFDGPAQVDAP
jgi:hypothetical protein